MTPRAVGRYEIEGQLGPRRHGVGASRAAAGGLNHPSIVPVIEYFEHEGVPFIAMEYLERGSLRPLVGRLTLAQVGGVLEPPRLAARLATGSPGASGGERVGAGARRARAPGGPVDRLTETERNVLAGMAEGRSNPAIARDLGISEAALQRHAASIFGKLDLPRDAEGHRRVLAVLTYLRAQEG